MKKTLSIIALSVLLVGAVFAAEDKKSSSWTDGLTVDGYWGFESEYVFRGHNIAHNVIQWNAQASYKLYNGTAYMGVLGYNGQQNVYTENDFYFGYKLPMDVYGHKFTADVGYTFYWYPNSSAAPTLDQSNEVYFGAIYNGLYINPSAYIYYDFNLEQITVEFSGKYSWDLAKYGVANTSLDVGGFIGFLNAEDSNGNQVAGTPNNGYSYWGATADVSYKLNKNASV